MHQNGFYKFIGQNLLIFWCVDSRNVALSDFHNIFIFFALNQILHASKLILLIYTSEYSAFWYLGWVIVPLSDFYNMHQNRQDLWESAMAQSARSTRNPNATIDKIYEKSQCHNRQIYQKPPCQNRQYLRETPIPQSTRFTRNTNATIDRSYEKPQCHNRQDLQETPMP